MYSLTGSFHIWLTLTVIKGDNKHMLHFFPSFKTCFSVYLTSMQKNLDRTVIFTLDNWDAFWPDPWVRKMFTLFFRVNGFFMLFGDGFRVSGYLQVIVFVNPYPVSFIILKVSQFWNIFLVPSISSKKWTKTNQSEVPQ